MEPSFCGDVKVTLATDYADEGIFTYFENQDSIVVYTTSSEAVGTVQELRFDTELADFPDGSVTGTYEIFVNMLSCEVDQSDFILP